MKWETSKINNSWTIEDIYNNCLYNQNQHNIQCCMLRHENIIKVSENLFYDLKNNSFKFSEQWDLRKFIQETNFKNCTSYYFLDLKMSNKLTIEEFIEQFKNDNIEELIDLFNKNGLRTYVLLHTLFGTNILLRKWFDADLFLKVLKVLKDPYDKHIMVEIFAGVYSPNNTDNKTIVNTFNNTNKQELKNELDKIKPMNKCKHVSYIIMYINTFNKLLTEEEENIAVSRLRKKRCMQYIQRFDDIKTQYKSSQDILNNIIFMNKITSTV